MSGAVFVTGATGFLGAELVRQLLENGKHVHAFARASSDRSVLNGLEVTWHSGDLTSADEVLASLEQAASASGTLDVIHSGAVVSYARLDRPLQQSVNVGGTRNVLDACRKAGVRRVVHVSSIVAVAHGSAERALDETAPFNGQGLDVAYVDTKRAAEELALAACPEMDLVVASPGAIFGPTGRASSNSSRFVREIAGGKKVGLAPPGGTSCVGVTDAARGVLLALERGRTGVRYILAESYWTHFEMLRQIAQQAGVPAVRRVAPGILWSSLRLAASAVDALSPLKYVTPQSLRMLGLHWNLDSSRARTELGFRPEPFGQVLARMVDACNT